MEKSVIFLGYRRDIDGLRAIAVFSVIFFHFGYLPNGYMGVDVFFAISGYLITKNVYGELQKNHFSIVQFYLRRIRRIIPLMLFTTGIALIVGSFVMLPNDLTNLSKSVIATNFFGNNILLLITTGDYWNIVNEYKPLMHTWSLGIEEQFYLIYPLIFLIFSGKRIRWILPVLWALTAISLYIFVSSSTKAAKFYSIQFRFFELSLGGIASIFFKDKILNATVKLVLVFAIIAILAFNIPLPADIKLISIILVSVLMLATENTGKITSIILENKVIVGIGKISFSLYMWHQIILAYTRYFVLPNYIFAEALIIIIIIMSLSILSYYFIEQPFRNKKRVKTRSLLWSTGIVFILSTGFSVYLYSIGGILKNVPELEIVYSGTPEIYLTANRRNIHTQYNNRVYYMDKNFSNDNRIKVLIVGNSFARDWANILMESKYSSRIELSYRAEIDSSKHLKERFGKADYIFFTELRKKEVNSIQKNFTLDTLKVLIIGTKNFGWNNGIFYNKKHDTAYCTQRTEIDKAILKRNASLKREWGSRYIDLISLVIDEKGKIPVFTPNCKFISQDCYHLTHSGAVYFARLLEMDPSFKLE